MMKNNIVKRISISSILLIVAITIAYGIYLKSQPTTQVDSIETQEEKQPKVKVEDVENKVTVDVPEMKITESEQEKKNQNQEKEVMVEVEKPIVPPKPEPPKDNHPKEESSSKPVNTDTKPIPKDEDVVKNGDEEENPNPPKYEEQPNVEENPKEDPVKDPVIITPEVPEDTTEDKDENAVPDSENPFLKPPSEVPGNGDRGERDSSNYGEGEWGTGDKF